MPFQPPRRHNSSSNIIIAFSLFLINIKSIRSRAGRVPHAYEVDSTVHVSAHVTLSVFVAESHLSPSVDGEAARDERWRNQHAIIFFAVFLLLAHLAVSIGDVLFFLFCKLFVYTGLDDVRKCEVSEKKIKVDGCEKVQGEVKCLNG